MKEHPDSKQPRVRHQAEGKPFRTVLKWRLFSRRPVWPKQAAQATHLSKPAEHVDGKIAMTYIGHATLLIQAAGMNILTDPHFSNRAGPFRYTGPKRVQPPGIDLTSLPPIDVIFVSHNHYDHLDLPSLRKLCKRDHPLVLTPIGNEKTIKRAHRGIRVRTLNWGDTAVLSPRVSLQLVPSKHWSARTLFDRNRALWGAACFRIDSQNVLFVADTGFSKKLFHEWRDLIGGHPDVAVLPIGSYEPRWLMSEVHMNPEEAWQAFKLLKGSYFIPIHHDVFPLGDEPYGEAIQRLQQAAGEEWNRVRPLTVGEKTEFYGE